MSDVCDGDRLIRRRGSRQEVDAGDCVGDGVEMSRYVGDLVGVLENLGHVALLPEGVLVGLVGGQRVDERAVICEDFEGATLQEGPEVSHSEVHREKFSAEGAVLRLRWGELAGEEG